VTMYSPIIELANSPVFLYTKNVSAQLVKSGLDFTNVYLVFYSFYSLKI
jgi:hypothetical protein